jgi:YD repeat-containing protein
MTTMSLAEPTRRDFLCIAAASVAGIRPAVTLAPLIAQMNFDSSAIAAGAIVAGSGLGLLNTSLKILGSSGVLGQSALGQGSSRAFVNAVSGNLVLQMQDAQLAGRGLDLYALRTYNSLGMPNDGNGDGWRWAYEQTVKFQGLGTPAQPQPGDTVIRTAGDGHETTYIWSAARAAYISTEGGGARDELRYDSAPGEWVWTDGSSRVMERYSYAPGPNTTGRLVTRTDTSGNSVVLTYDGGRLTAIQDSASQQELRLIYGLFNGSTRLQRLETRALIDDASGRATATLGGALPRVKYGYDNSGRLSTVTADLTPADGSIADGVVFVTTYTYDGTTTRIASVTQSDGTSVFFTYDAGRIRAVRDQSGATGTQQVFTYSPETNSTAITDGNGQVWTYRYDGTSRQLTEILSPMVGGANLSTKFKYESGNLVSITDPRNNTVIYEYDSNGNRALERDAKGNTVTRTFSAINQMLTETRYRVADPDGAGAQSASDPLTTRYVYDTNSRLRFVVSAEGRVTENRYGTANVGYGLLTRTLQYVGELYDVSGLGPTAQLTEAQLTAWAAGLQDKSRIQLTEYSYDLRGNMSQRTSYGSVSAAGNGILDDQARLTQYIYDAQSHLGQQIAMRGTARDQRAPITSFTYDGIGRALTATGVNGGQTTVYDDANGRISVSAASRLTETRTFDNRGRLVCVSQIGDAMTRQTRYVYNNADQLRMAEDAQGSRRYRFYDAAGRLEYSVDATGAVTGFEYNSTGQLVRQTRYLNRADTSNWYDRATLKVTKESLTVGGASSDVQIDPTHDRATSFDYDAAGGLRTSTDAVGTVTTASYDGLSRVIMTQTGDRVTRHLYDRDNRKVGVVDPLGYLTEYKYDAGGRLVETARYSQRSPAAANMAAPVWIGITNQNAIAGKPFEYHMPAYDADGDQITRSLVGTPPGWLSFDAGAATLRGTPPATVANYSVTLRADDGRGKTADVTVLIDVASSDPSSAGGTGPVWVSLPPLDVIANRAANYVVPSATGQSLTYRAVSGLPPGLSFDPATLTITGTSTAVGFYNIVLRATNASGGSVDRTVSVQIRTTAFTPAQPAGSDQLSSWRPSDTSALRSYVYYDGQGRVVGSVDEQQFLTETVYDDALNTKRILRYLTPVIVSPSDTMASLKGRAGTSSQASLIQYDGFGRVLETTELDGSTMTHNEYDEAGRLIRIVTAANTSEQRGRRTFYNAFGEVIATLGGEGDAWLGTNPTRQRINEAIRDYGVCHEYDILGRKIRSVDANGNKTLFYYDRENRLTHAIYVIGQSADNTLAGEVSETSYNSFGETATVRRYATRLAAADMAQLLASSGGGLADQSLLSKLAALANTSLDQVSSYEYDRSGRLVKQVDEENDVTVNFYTAFGELAAQVRSTRQGQNTTKQLDYDLNGRVVCTTDDVGGINSNSLTIYDAFGRVTQSINGGGKFTTTAYQDNGRTIVVTDPLNRTTRTEYDAFGRVLRVTNALNQQTVYAYNEAARSATVTTPEGVQVTTARTRHGEILSVTDGRGNVTRYAYNKDGQLWTATDALGQVIADTTYDRSGRKFEVADARGTITRFGYDQRNRVAERWVDPTGLNLKTLFEFNALGQQIKVTEGANTVAARVTTYAYDRKSQLTRVMVDPNGLKLSTRYTFDGVGNTVKVEQGTAGSPSQQVTFFEFDQVSRRVKKVEAPSAVFGPGSPDTRDLTTEHNYDAAGRLSCTIHPDGTRTWYVYDAADQQIQTINAMGEVSESVYDPNGRVAQSRRYVNRLKTEDLAKLGDAITAPVTLQVNTTDQRSYFVYDNDGRQRYTLQANIGTSWTIAENRFDANGNIVETRRYDKFLPEARLNAIDTSTSPGISVAETQAELITLGYSDADSALAKTQRTRSAYDANNRLRFTVDALGSVSESVYDPAGQLVSRVRYATRPTLTDITESAVNAALNRVDASNQVSHYAYDAAGRLRYSVLVLASDATGKPNQQLVGEQAYDSLGRVVQTIAYATLLGPVADYKAATLASAITAGAQDRRSAFVYDAAGRKIYSVQLLIAGSQNIVSKAEFDALDRLVGATSYATTMALADFGKTTLDSATTTNANAQDRTTRFVYDAVGRQRFAVGADGSLSEKVYDALGRIKESRAFNLLLSNITPPTEDALSAWRAGRAVGDSITRGEKHSYDRAGRLWTTTDAAGFTETNEYNALGDKTRFIDKNGATWRYDYDRQGRLFNQYSPAVVVQLSNETAPTSRSLQTQLYYDAFGSLVKRIEAAQTVDQRITEYAYDRLGRQIVMVQPGWYDPATGRVEPISAAGRFQRSLATTYDTLGNQVRTKLRTGFNSYQYEYKTYDNFGRVVYDVDALSNVTAFAYDAFGEQTSVTRYGRSVGTPPQGVDTPWTASALASALGNDPLGRPMTMRYDNLGRKTQTIQPTVASYFFSGSTGRFVPLDSSITPVSASGGTTFEYNPFGELFHQTLQLDSARAQETWRYYDTMGRETRTIVKSSDNIAGDGPPRPGGFHTARSYDAFGNVTRVIEYGDEGEAGNSGNVLTAPPTPHETSADRISSYVYDARNQQTDTLRSNLSYTALENGQYVQVELGRGDVVKVRHTDYDGLRRVRASTDAMNNLTRSAYNALGQLIQVTEPARLVVKSGLSNLDPFLVDSQVLTSPVTDLVLNPFGQTVKSTRSPGRSDVAGATLIVSTSYDFGGNAISTTDAKGNVKNWQYDFSGRLVKETQAISSELGARFVVPQGFQVWKVVSHTRERHYAYDAVGHMTDALDVFMDGSTLAQSGQRKVYNAFGEVTEEQIVWGAASDALSNLQHATRLHYSYDNAGNLVTEDGADGQTQFFYNLTGQMTRAEQRGDNSTADGTHTRVGETGYDLMGRPVWQSKPVFSPVGRMVTPVTSLSLDRWGNVTRRTEAGTLADWSVTNIRITFYEYNADNKVISAELGSARALRADGTSYPATVTHQTRYDLAGRAVEQIDVAENTLTFSLSTLRTRSTTYDGIGQVVEQKDAEQLAQGRHGLRYAYDTDGNKVATVNAVGNVFVDEYDANGNQLTHKVLRLSPGGENDTYVSGSGNVPVAVLLNSHSYDQANRRIETRDYVLASLFNANYAQYDERGFVRGTFQLQAKDVATWPPLSQDPGRETSYVYDILGNKVQQTDDSGHSMAWSYNTAADAGGQPNLTINRLTSATSTAAGGGFTHTTAYTYTDFGQVKQETYTGTDITVSTAWNNRVYEYKENGLLDRTTDYQTVGTPGWVGGLDYWSSKSINRYTYTDGGLKATVHVDTNVDSRGWYEDFDRSGDCNQDGCIQYKELQPERRTIDTSYDERDRPLRVLNFCIYIGDSQGSSADVTYDYDELGNHTRITFSSFAVSTPPGGNPRIVESIKGQQLWFSYDHEGRMTLANKIIEQDGTVHAGVVITYDAAGRRATTLTPEGKKTRIISDPDSGNIVESGSWDQSRLERYTYNDLGYLTKIEQAGVRSNKWNLLNNTPILPADPGPSPFMPSETRSYDLLGNLLESSQYSPFSFVSAFNMTMEPQSLVVTVNNQYTAAGLLDTQTSTHPASPGADTVTKNLYDNHGILQSYTYTQRGTDDHHGFKNTYTYSYSFKAGALRERGIDVESNLENSTTTQQRNTYDGRGNLVWQRTIDVPGNREMVFFDYDGSGRVLDKSKIDLLPGGQEIWDDAYNSFFYNSSGEAIGNVPTSSWAATRKGWQANFGIGFTPVSPTYPSSQPSSYAVGPGDTLDSIAKSFLGDEQLWYLIADANGLTAGHADSLESQGGRSLRIPNVVANAHNNADTFSPYNPNPIVSNTPWVGAPLPPRGPSGFEESVLQMAPYLGMEVSIALAVVLSPLGPLGAGIASAAGELANESIQVGFGGKGWRDFGYGLGVAEAGLQGYAAGELSAIGSAAGGGLAVQALAQAGAAAATYTANSSIHAAFHLGEAPTSFDGWSLLAATAGAAATPVLGGFFSRLARDVARDALNSKTGWVWHRNARAWDAFYQDLVIDVGQLVIQDSFGSRDSPKPKQGSQDDSPSAPPKLSTRAFTWIFAADGADDAEGADDLGPDDFYYDENHVLHMGISERAIIQVDDAEIPVIPYIPEPFYLPKDSRSSIAAPGISIFDPQWLASLPKDSDYRHQSKQQQWLKEFRHDYPQLENVAGYDNWAPHDQGILTPSGVRVPDPGDTLSPRHFYERKEAAFAAYQGFIHIAELYEAGHDAAAQQEILRYDPYGVYLPPDKALDLTAYWRWSRRAMTTRVTVEFGMLAMNLAMAAADLYALWRGATPSQPAPPSSPSQATPPSSPSQAAPPRSLPTMNIRYTSAMRSPSDANFLRFNIEWAQQARGYLTLGVRNSADSTLRSWARSWMDRAGLSRAGKQAMHPLDSAINPWVQTGIPGRTYYFGDQGVNASFGGQIGAEIQRLNLQLGDDFLIELRGFPSYATAPPTTPPASPPNL